MLKIQIVIQDDHTIQTACSEELPPAQLGAILLDLVKAILASQPSAPLPTPIGKSELVVAHGMPSRRR